MSRVREYFERHAPSCITWSIEALVWLANVVMVWAGLAMTAFALFVYIEFHHLESKVHAGNGPSNNHISLHATNETTILCPWFVYAFGAAGIVTALTPVTALTGMACKSIYLMNCNIVVMCVLMGAQVCLAVAYYADDEKGKETPDLPPQYGPLKKFMEQSMIVMQWLGLSVLAFEAVTLLLSCCIQSIYVSIEEAEEDVIEEENYNHRRPLNPRPADSSGLPQRQRRTDEWSRRMNDRYGLDTSQFTYDPERDASNGELGNTLPRPQSTKRSACVVM